MHRILFEVGGGQQELFDLEKEESPRRLLRCEKKNVLFRGGGTDWREVQANMGMAALLMPRGLFRDVTCRARKMLGLEAVEVRVNTIAMKKLAEFLSCRFEVSKQAASIRLEVLGYLTATGQLGIAANG